MALGTALVTTGVVGATGNVLEGLLAGGQKESGGGQEDWQAILQAGLGILNTAVALNQIRRANKITDQWMSETRPELYHAPGWKREGGGVKILAPPDTGMSKFLRGYGKSQPYGGQFQAQTPYGGMVGGR